MKKYLLFAVLGGANLLSGCTSIMVFQDAKTVPQGNLETGIGVAAGSYSAKRTLQNFDFSVPSVAGNAWLRYGIIKGWDTGINLSIPGNITADTKIMFMSEDNGAPFTFSGGLGYGFSAGNPSNKDDYYDQKRDITDYIVPLYVSKDVKDWLTLYVSPRYFYRRTYNEVRYPVSGPQSETLYDNMFGVGGGVAFNFTEKTRLMLECQYTAPFNDTSFNSTQCGVGLATRWGHGSNKK